MKPYYQDNHIRIFNKDCRSMDELPDESVQVVVTSPPYWGLRKYSGEQELIWGKQDCEHQWNIEKISAETWNRDGHVDFGDKNPKRSERPNRWQTVTHERGFCSLCGAWKGAYGLEPTPEMYIEHTIQILREIRRVLRKDGVVFWNIGDSYAGSGSPGGDFRDGKGGDEYLRPYNRKGGVLKPLDLCLIPSQLALAAREDGWWCRSIIIWSKQNPMPESVNGWRWEQHRIKVKRSKRTDNPTETEGMDYEPRGKPHLDEKYLAEWRDCPGCKKCSPNDGYVLCKGSWRPTESHEYLLMLTKSDTYYSDADAVREPHTESTLTRIEYGLNHKHPDGIGIGIPPVHTERMGERFANPAGRNLRSVWTFPTMPFPAFKIDGKKLDHFAVFPEKLPELCIKAGTPEVGCCSKCSAPWARVVESKQIPRNELPKNDPRYRPNRYIKNKYADELREGFECGMYKEAKTIGWKPTCKCNAPRVPSLVLDNFAGAGTTLKVAKKLNRYAVGYEISEEYCRLIVERCRQQVML